MGGKLSARRRMYGTCRRCPERILVNSDGRTRSHRLDDGEVCPGTGGLPLSDDCQAEDCWPCQIDGR